MPTCFKLENEGTFLNSWKLLCTNSYIFINSVTLQKSHLTKKKKKSFPKIQKGKTKPEQPPSLRILCIRTITAQTWIIWHILDKNPRPNHSAKLTGIVVQIPNHFHGVQAHSIVCIKDRHTALALCWHSLRIQTKK